LLYGPGFDNYSSLDSINNIIEKSNFHPDIIILGHAWLNDKDGSAVDPHPNLQLNKTNIFKAVIFNKEYTNLDQKVNYIRENNFDVGFSHHHNLDLFSKTKTPFIFWPFAYDDNKFNYNPENCNIDVGFSGILQNQNKNASQSDIRIKIMNIFYQTFFDVPFFRKNEFKELNIFWNSISRSIFGRYLSIILKKRKYLNDNEYSNLIENSKIFINTLSPMGLISPRFFECMGSGTLVFCEESNLYSNIFPSETYVTFKPNLEDFAYKVNFYLNEKKERQRIVEKAYEFITRSHNWSHRVNDLLTMIKKAKDAKFT